MWTAARPAQRSPHPPPVDRRCRAYIRWLQAALNQVASAHLRTDGRFAPATAHALRAFQRQRGLAPDGVAGPRTEAALVAAGAPRPWPRGAAVAPLPAADPPPQLLPPDQDAPGDAAMANPVALPSSASLPVGASPATAANGQNGAAPSAPPSAAAAERSSDTDDGVVAAPHHAC